MEQVDKNAIAKENMRQLEYLFAQSVQGIHLLFDNQSLAQILSRPSEELDVFSFENLDRVQNLFMDFIQRETLDEKRAFLDSLSSDTFELLVRTYFNIVENAILEASEYKH